MNRYRAAARRVVREAMAEHPEVEARLVTSPAVPLPHGWLGKPWSSERLAAESRGDVLVFVDADVVLAPHGHARPASHRRMRCAQPRPRGLTI